MKNILFYTVFGLLFTTACAKKTMSDPISASEAAPPPPQQDVLRANKLKAEVTSYGLARYWESDTVFTTAESVLYDDVSQTIFVSNIDGQAWAEDGKGSIGKLGLDGKVINAKWAIGLNAPKGMAIAKRKLYVTDNTRIVEIDITSGKILNKYEVPGCEGLNDVTSAPDGTVYFTDSKKGVAHMLKNGVVSTIVDKLGGSNGILYVDNKLLLATWADSSLIEYNLATKAIKKYSNNLPRPDGIEPTGDGSYLVSSWQGLIHRVTPSGTRKLVFDSTKDKISSADIDYVPSMKMIIVPTFFRNSVAAYMY
jgi:sugar lactone lactonase YvrE